MRKTWYYCEKCKTTHPETWPGAALLVCPYCSSTSIAIVSRSEVAASLRDGTRRPNELKATCADRTSSSDLSTQANIHMTGEFPISLKPAETNACNPWPGDRYDLPADVPVDEFE